MSSVRRVNAADRQADALRLRKAGVGFDRIASELGFASRAGAHKAVMSALRATVREPADELRTLEVERLDAMLIGLWPKASKGDPRSVEVALKAMERRAALLGLDAPEEVSFGGTMVREYRIVRDDPADPAGA